MSKTFVYTMQDESSLKGYNEIVFMQHWIYIADLPTIYRKRRMINTWKQPWSSELRIRLMWCMIFLDIMKIVF